MKSTNNQSIAEIAAVNSLQEVSVVKFLEKLK